MIIRNPGVILPDVEIKQPQLSIFWACVGVSDIRATFPNRLDFGTPQNQPCLERFRYLVIIPSPSIGGNCFVCWIGQGISLFLTPSVQHTLEDFSGFLQLQGFRSVPIPRNDLDIWVQPYARDWPAEGREPFRESNVQPATVL